jgi:hypothetical protein
MNYPWMTFINNSDKNMFCVFSAYLIYGYLLIYSCFPNSLNTTIKPKDANYKEKIKNKVNGIDNASHCLLVPTPQP